MKIRMFIHRLLRVHLLLALVFVLAPASLPANETAKEEETKKEAPAKKAPAKKAPAKGKKKDEPVLHSWKSVTGHEIKAEFVEVKSGEVLLKDEEGAMRNIRLSLLTEDFQKLAHELQKAKESAPVSGVVRKSSNQLPVFSEGPYKNLHAVYDHPNFIAKVAANASITIQCKENGKPVGKIIRLRSAHTYYNKARKRVVGRGIVSFDSFPQPTLTPGELVFEGMLADGVAFGFGVEFKGNTVQAWGWVEDPPGIAAPTRYYRYFSLPRTHTFEPHVKVAEQKKVLSPYSVAVKPVQGRTVVYPYGDIVKGWSKASSLVTINGAIFGERKVSVAPSTTREGTMIPSIYSGYAPYQGFGVRLRKEKASSRNDKCRIIMTID